MGARLGLCSSVLLALACSEGRGAAPAGPGAGRPQPASSDRLFVYECQVGENRDVCTVPVGGGLERRLTEHPAADMWPRFTRDGRAVLFSSERDGRWQLWEVALEGGEARRSRTSPAREWQSDPAPDFRRVAFISDAGGEESLRVAEREATSSGSRARPEPAGARPGRGVGLGRQILSHGPGVVLGNPHWSPDGRWLVLSSNAGRTGHHVYLVPAEGGQARRLSPLLSGACEPRFSPDGRKVAYVRRRHLTRERSVIVEHDLEGGRERVLVDWPAINYDPVYSPDGKELAFVSTIAGAHAIYRQRLADGQAWRVTFRHPARHPDYRPPVEARPQ